MTVPPNFPPEFPAPPGRPGPPEIPVPPAPPARMPYAPVVAPGAITVVAGQNPTDTAVERLLDLRIVHVGGQIDDDVAHRVVAQLLVLAERDARRDIHLWVHSPGGSATAGTAILDAMRYVGPDVTTTAIGLAASVGQVLVTAGAPGKRRITPHARLLLSQPDARLGGSSDLTLRAGVFGTLKRELAQVVADAAGKDVDAVLADADAGRWFTAAEAVEYGLVDSV